MHKHVYSYMICLLVLCCRLSSGWSFRASRIAQTAWKIKLRGRAAWTVTVIQKRWLQILRCDERCYKNHHLSDLISCRHKFHKAIWQTALVGLRGNHKEATPLLPSTLTGVSCPGSVVSSFPSVLFVCTLWRLRWNSVQVAVSSSYSSCKESPWIPRIAFWC